LGAWIQVKVGTFPYLQDREQVFESTRDGCGALKKWIAQEGHLELHQFSKLAGMTFTFNLDGLRGKKQDSVPKFEVHSIRPARRVGPDGDTLNQLIISLIQSRDVLVDPNAGPKSPKMVFRGGCTLILDLDTMLLRYHIKKDIADEARLEFQRNYRLNLQMEGSLRATYFNRLDDASEPFALLHRSFDYGRP